MVPPAGAMIPPSSTVTATVADFPSTSAVIVAVPTPTPVTTPLVTVAIVGADVLHATVLEIGCPPASRTVADKLLVSAGTRSSAVEETVILSATTGATTSLQLPNRKSPEATTPNSSLLFSIMLRNCGKL